MKTKKWMSMTAFAATLLLGSSCTHEWGQMDPPAGNQIYPTMQSIATYAFDSEEELDPVVIQLSAYDDGEMPSLYDDELAQSPVLDLTGGYARFNNPLKSVQVQNAVSYTFWMKQISDPVLDEEGNPIEGEVMPQDVESPIMYWENENGSASLSFSANGWLKYAGLDGAWEENNPAEYKTGYITPDEWHYVALIVRDHGYAIYVDGDKKADVTSSDKNYAGAVQFAANAPYMYFNYGADTHASLYLEDLSVYRNEIEAKQIARPKKGNIGGGGSGDDPGSFEYVVGDPILNIGASDCSTGWWTEFSNYYRLPVASTLNLKFVNHTSGGGNWNNWNLCVCTDAERGGDGYEEYFVIRSDLYGWGNAYNGDNFSNEGYGDWDQFRADMEGAVVNMEISRVGSEVYVDAVATAKNGTVYREMFHATCGDGSQVVRAFLIVDGSYLELDKNGISIANSVPLTVPNIGASDCSTGWWAEFSDYFTVPSNAMLHLEFVNHTSGGGNWNNWNLCVSTAAERGGDGYEEYFVIRSDLYGWGNAYNGDNFSNEGYGDWDQFRADMEGAYVTMDIVRSGAEVNVDAIATAKNGTVYREMFHATCGDGNQDINAFLIVDGSYLEMKADKCKLSLKLFN